MNCVIVRIFQRLTKVKKLGAFGLIILVFTASFFCLFSKDGWGNIKEKSENIPRSAKSYSENSRSVASRTYFSKEWNDRSELKLFFTELIEEDPDFVKAHLWDSGLSSSCKIEVASGLIYFIDPESGVEWVENMVPRSFQEQFLGVLISRMIESNPELAMTEFTRLFESQRYGASLQRVFVSSLVYCDPEEAFSFAVENFNLHPEDNSMFDSIFAVLAEKDLELSLKLLNEKKYPGNYSLLASKIAIQKLSSYEDPSSVFDWASSLSGDDGYGARAMALKSLVESDAAEATLKLEALDRETRKQLSAEVAGHWASLRPSECADWLTGYLEEHQDVEPLKALVGTWVQTEPSAVYEWLGTLEKGPVRDEGIMMMVMNEARLGTADKNLVEWIGLIGNSQLVCSRGKVDFNPPSLWDS